MPTNNDLALSKVIENQFKLDPRDGINTKKILIRNDGQRTADYGLGVKGGNNY